MGYDVEEFTVERTSGDKTAVRKMAMEGSPKPSSPSPLAPTFSLYDGPHPSSPHLRQGAEGIPGVVDGRPEEPLGEAGVGEDGDDDVEHAPVLPSRGCKPRSSTPTHPNPGGARPRHAANGVACPAGT